MNRLIDFTSRFRILKGGKISLVVSALLGTTIIASANPIDGVVTSGNATISSSGNTTNINQSTQKASINWQNFSIGSNETVNFNQPSSSSITLNKVIGNEKSVIDGALNANGQVWILNSNGILFSKNSSINTAGLLATTAELSEQDFQNGNYNFKNSSSNSVINLGTVKVQNSSYVILAGNEVENGGTIEAIKGKVHLVGANEYSINLNGNSLVNLKVNKGVLDALVKNSGNILANGGEVFLTTNAVDELLKGVVNNSGIIEANSLDGITGKVQITGEEINLKSGSKITATGENGGGEILVGGDWQGSSNLKQAVKVTMEENSTIDASATKNGDGGKVVLWSDIKNADSITEVHGTIKATAGSQSGNGGKIETSGYTLNVDNANVTAGANNGKGGLWYLDPANNIIDQTVANSYATTLNTGTDVLNDVQGNISWGSGVTLTKTSGGAATLTLRIGNYTIDGNNITLSGATINNTSSNPLNLVFWTRYNSPSYSGYIRITGSSITTNGGNIWMGGSNDTTTTTWNGLNVGSGSAATWATDGQGIYIDTSTINTGSGNISLSGKSYVTGGYTGIKNYGVGIEHGSNISTTSGNIDINGYLDGKYRYGAGILLGSYYASGNVSITTTSGYMNISGYQSDISGSDTGWRNGFVLINVYSNNLVTLKTTSGNITLTGSSTPSSATYSNNDNQALLFQSLNPTTTNTNSFIKVISQTGNISLYGSNTIESTQGLDAIGFYANDYSNSIRIGYDGTNTYSGNILIQGNSLYQTINQSGAGSISVQTTGNLTIQSALNSFTYLRAGSNGTLTFDDDWNFGTNLGSFTLGKTTNTSAITLSNALTTMGAINIYGGNIALNTNLTTTSTGGDILLKASGNIIQAANTTIQTNSGDITYWANSDGETINGGYIYIQDGVTIDTRSASDRLANNGTSDDTNGGAITLGGGTDITTGYALEASGTVLPAGIQFGTSSGIAHNANIKLYSGSGNVTIRGKSTVVSNTESNGILSYEGLTIDAGATGNITLDGQGGVSGATYSSGIYLGFQANNNAATLIKTKDGNISLTGAGTGATNNRGINLVGKSTQQITLESIGIGAITLTGTGATQDLNIYSSNILSASGAITLIGTTSTGALVTATGVTTIGFKASSDVTSSTSNITIEDDSFSLASGYGLQFNTTGTVTINSHSSDFASAFTTTDFAFNSGITGLTIGKSSSADGTSDAAVTLTNAISIAGPINIYGGSITINAKLESTGTNTITLNGSGTVIDGASGYVKASNLLLTDGAVTLDNILNDVDNIATNGVDSLTFYDTDGINIGSIGSITGISSIGNIILSAGITTSAGTSTGGDITATGTPTISSTSGYVKLYTGSISGSTTTAALISAGNFRYNSDETTTNFTTVLGIGRYLIYRERPTSTITIDNKTITYADNNPTWTYTLNSGVNGDSVTFSTSPTISIGGTKSTSNNYIAGNHTVS